MNADPVVVRRDMRSMVNGAGADSMPDPAENVVVLDAATVQSLGGSCGSH